MKANGKPVRAGEVFRQAGSVATAVKSKHGLHWEVRRESDGLVRFTKCLADVSHWHKA
jgi:hypothetical protein